MTRIADMTSPEITDAAVEALLPCPFCGGEAERVDIEDGDNAGGSCVCCKQCLASSNVEFGFKENFVSNWNRRAALPHLAAGRAEAVAAPAAPSEAQDDEDRCIACDKPFKPGDMVLNDVSGGSIHIECCGPDRESYVGPGDPFPKGYAWQPAPEAEPAPVAWPSGFFAIGGE